MPARRRRDSRFGGLQEGRIIDIATHGWRGSCQRAYIYTPGSLMFANVVNNTKWPAFVVTFACE